MQSGYMVNWSKMHLQARKSHQKKTVYVTLNTCCFHTFKIIRDCQRKCPISCRPLQHRNSVTRFKYVGWETVAQSCFAEKNSLIGSWERICVCFVCISLTMKVHFHMNDSICNPLPQFIVLSAIVFLERPDILVKSFTLFFGVVSHIIFEFIKESA